MAFIAEKSGDVWLCGCKSTGGKPFCDGTHKDFGLRPMPFVAEKTEQAWLCSFKASGSKPFCDGPPKQV